MKEGRQGRGSRRLTRQISCDCVRCVDFRWPKTTIFDFFGAPVPAPFNLWGPNLVCYRWPTAHVYVSKFVSIGLFYRVYSGGEKPQFGPFFGLWHLVCRQLAAIWESWTRVHNYKPSLIQRHQNHFCIPTSSWWNRAHKLWRSKALRTEKAWRTNKKLTVFRRPGGGWNPISTKLGKVIEDLEHVLAPLKRLGSDA